MNDLNAIFDPCFPIMSRSDVSKSATPDGAELMNRTQGASPTEGPGRTGRPRKPEHPIIARMRLNIDPENPEATALILADGDSHKWLAGSVLRILLPNGEAFSVVLVSDTVIAPWLE